MKKLFLFSLLIFAVSNIASSQIKITNRSIFNTAEEMLFANELFQSGEPFDEAIGYNLDDLDPLVPNKPDSTSYTLGIENYEYSRYLLRTLNAASGLGLSIVWSPIIKKWLQWNRKVLMECLPAACPMAIKKMMSL